MHQIVCLLLNQNSDHLLIHFYQEEENLWVQREQQGDLQIKTRGITLRRRDLQVVVNAVKQNARTTKARNFKNEVQETKVAKGINK
jgi:hypothetical protein